MHALKGGWSLDFLCRSINACELLVCQDERTNSCVRTNERALVTLYTVVYIPYRHECGNATLLPASCAVVPCTVNSVIFHEVRNLEKVTCLGVDRTNEILHECRSCILYHSVVWEVSPCRVNCQLLVLTTTVNSGVVLINDILSLLAV